MESLGFDTETIDHQQCASETRSSCCMPLPPSDEQSNDAFIYYLFIYLFIIKSYTKYKTERQKQKMKGKKAAHTTRIQSNTHTL